MSKVFKDTSDEHVRVALVRASVAYATSHGICTTLPRVGDAPQRYAHAPFSLLPSPLTRAAWREGLALGPLYARLVDRVASDRAWMYQVLGELEQTDPFTNRLIDLWSAGPMTQSITLGLHRSDYMIEAESERLLQIELNTIASSYGALSAKIRRMHDYVTRRYQLPRNELPENPAIGALSTALAVAHSRYCAQQDRDSTGPLILFIVREEELNTFDQRALEYELFRAHELRVIRRSLGQLGEQARLAANGRFVIDDEEVSVAYFRSGFAPDDHPTESEWRARLLLERSLAVKCPSIAYHLVGTKKVQQALAAPGALERFITDPEACARVRASFTGLWALCPATRDVQRDAAANPQNYVLKPQREGGGNNLYGSALKDALETMTAREKAAYILMARIFPATVDNTLVRDSVARVGPTISEFGFFSAYLADGCDSDRQAVHDASAGHIVRSKFLGVDEGGVSTGFSYLSSPDIV